MHRAAALLQQPDDVLVLDLLVHLELLEGGTQGLEEGAEVAVVGEVGLGQLCIPQGNRNNIIVFLRAPTVQGSHHHHRKTGNGIWHERAITFGPFRVHFISLRACVRS